MAQTDFLKIALKIILKFVRKIIPQMYSFNRFVRVILLKLKTHCSNSNCLTKWGQLCYYHWKKITAENQCVRHKWHINGKINRMNWNINDFKLFKFRLFDKMVRTLLLPWINMIAENQCVQNRRNNIVKINKWRNYTSIPCYLFLW